MKKLLLAFAVLSSSASFANDWGWSTGGSPAAPSAPSNPGSGSGSSGVFLVPGVGQSQDKAGAITSFEGNNATIRQLAFGSPLAAAGLEVGDGILQINFQPVTSAARYAQLIVNSFGPTALTVGDGRTGQVRTVYVNL